MAVVAGVPIACLLHPRTCLLGQSCTKIQFKKESISTTTTQQYYHWLQLCTYPNLWLLWRCCNSRLKIVMYKYQAATWVFSHEEGAAVKIFMYISHPLWTHYGWSNYLCNGWERKKVMSVCAIVKNTFTIA